MIFLATVHPKMSSFNTFTHSKILDRIKTAHNMAQLWKSLSLIHYKDLKYNIVDYALISVLTYYCV